MNRVLQFFKLKNSFQATFGIGALVIGFFFIMAQFAITMETFFVDKTVKELEEVVVLNYEVEGKKYTKEVNVKVKVNKDGNILNTVSSEVIKDEGN